MMAEIMISEIAVGADHCKESVWHLALRLVPVLHMKMAAEIYEEVPEVC